MYFIVAHFRIQEEAKKKSRTRCSYIDRDVIIFCYVSCQTERREEGHSLQQREDENSDVENE